MVKHQKIISVFISSPSDVTQERATVIEIIEDVNKLIGDQHGCNFQPVTWENDVLPTFGNNPQATIDAEVGDEYDLFLGIMSTKFGTPTESASSGTEHEFERAYSRKMNNPEAVEILFYFQEPGHSGRQIDVKELGKVENFKSKISDKGIYANYKSLEDFKTKVTSHLSKLMPRILEGHATEDPAEATAQLSENDDTVSPSQKNLLADPLEFLSGLDDSDEPGFMELTEQTEDAFSATRLQLEALSTAVTKMGDDIQEQASILTSSPGTLSQSETRNVLRDSSRSMEAFVETSAAVLPLFRNHLSEGIRLSRDLIIVLSQDNVGTKKDRDDLSSAFVTMRLGMQRGLSGFEDLSSTLGSLPRATSEFNRAKKRTKAIVDGVCSLISDALNQIEEIEDALLP